MPKLTKIADLDHYTEGPVTDGKGNIFFTTLTGGAIMRQDNSGHLHAWAHTDCPNGQVIADNGDHLVCDSKRGKVIRFSPEGRFLREETHGQCAGVRIQVPNDLLHDSQGNLYFTDSIRHDGSVFCVMHDGREARVAAGLDYPNGIALSAGGRMLYVAESYRNRIIRMDLHDTSRSVDDFEVFTELPAHPSGDPVRNLPDGIAFNREGVLAVAHYGMQAVQLIGPDGKLLATHDSGMPCTSNVMFLNDRTLIVTGGYGEPGPGAVFRLEL